MHCIHKPLSHQSIQPSQAKSKVSKLSHIIRSGTSHRILLFIRVSFPGQLAMVGTEAKEKRVAKSSLDSQYNATICKISRASKKQTSMYQYKMPKKNALRYRHVAFKSCPLCNNDCTVDMLGAVNPRNTNKKTPNAINASRNRTN